MRQILRFLRLTVCTLCFTTVLHGAAADTKDLTLYDETDSISYCLGLMFGQSLDADQVPEINLQVAAQAILLGMQNQSLASFPPEAAQAYMQQLADSNRQKKETETLEAGREFLANNMSQAGVIVRPSGLQYRILTDGTGPHPSPADLVTIRFYGALIDGTVFEQSSAEGSPVQLYIEDVIPGLAEALQLMKVGSSWMVYIPSELAYGSQSPTDLIAPNSTLICEVELISIDFQED